MQLFRKLLLPFVPLYYVITWVRNWMYDKRFFKSTQFEVPTIIVGNLNVGGTGKSPMVEYIVRLLKDDMQLAILSRGYKRESNGFILASEIDSAKTLGDEPFQFYSKFNEVLIAVDTNRVNGISQLLKNRIRPEAIVLDDAYQHRKVRGGFNILLTAYDSLYSKDMLLPVGNLREPRKGARRASVVVVTKCPKDLSSAEREEISRSLNIRTNQELVFSSIAYNDKVVNALHDEMSLIALQEKKVVLITGIANPRPMFVFLTDQNIAIKKHLDYPDHHQFSASEINEFQRLNKDHTLLTTEKDFVRLKNEIPSLYYLEIKTEFLGEDGQMFDVAVKEYVASIRKRL